MFNEGDNSKAICPVCKDVTTTTMTTCDFSYTTIAIGGRSHEVLVQGVLHGVCDVCGEFVSLPHQSIPYINAIKDTIEKTVRDSQNSQQIIYINNSKYEMSIENLRRIDYEYNVPNL